MKVSTWRRVLLAAGFCSLLTQYHLFLLSSLQQGKANCDATSLDEALKVLLHGGGGLAQELEEVVAISAYKRKSSSHHHAANSNAFRHAKARRTKTRPAKTPPPETSSSSSSSSPRTMILFIISKDHQLNRQRIAEMRRFYKNNFMVIWDNAETPKCPFHDMMKDDDDGNGLLVCIDEYRLSKSKKLSHMCCAQEKAVMWAIDNRHLFDHVWFMEEDVYATDMAQLDKVISLKNSNNSSSSSSHDHVDFLHQRQHLGRMSEKWFYADEVIRDAKGLFQPFEMKQGLFNLFRMSKNLLAALEQVYIALDEEWFFFEILVPSVVASNRFGNLTHASWLRQLQDNVEPTKNSSMYFFKARPFCVTRFERPGIYHPAKYRDGNFVSCPLRKFAPNDEKGSPYKNQVSKLRLPSSDTKQPPLVHGCLGPLGNSTNWNAIAGWVKYHEERWGLTHVDIFVLDNQLFHVAKDSFDSVGLASNVALNFTLYSNTTTANGEAWSAEECRTNAIVAKRDFLIEFELDRFLVADDSSSFKSLQDLFDHTENADAVVFPTYTNHYGICSSSNSMTFASATFVSPLSLDFNRAPKACKNKNPCKMSDKVIRHFMIGNDDQDENRHERKTTVGPHLVRFAYGDSNDAVGLHEDLHTQSCLSIKDCKHIGDDGDCTDMSEFPKFEQQATSINSILSDLDLIPRTREFKRHAICYAQRYNHLFKGYCNNDVSKCRHGGLHDHYIKHGSKANLKWECDTAAKADAQ